MNLNENSNMNNKSFNNLISKKDNQNISSKNNQNKNLNSNLIISSYNDKKQTTSNYKSFTNLYGEKINHQRK